MSNRNSIITIGLSPAWDIACRGRNLDWGLHRQIDRQTIMPAGKALNVSKALTWMGQRSIAAGLWGSDDYEQMLAAVRKLWPLIRVQFTTVPAVTRKNITIVDSAGNKEMHLRDKSRLASAKTLKKLKADLKAIVRKGSVCVFAGTMPDSGLLGLKEIVDTGLVWLIKPNVDELCELLGEHVKDRPTSLAKAGRKLLEKVEIVLISRGAKGAMAVTKDGAWQGRCAGRAKIFSTVGCGDFLLAGFLKALKDRAGTDDALKTAIKVATAKAWGWTEKKSWPDAQSSINVHVEQI
ncbi:MAG: 1-phosphofructokinase family hexose kinase [Planctomycetota bacterium]